MEKRDTKKSIRNLILFIALIFVTFYVIFKDQNPKDILKLVRNAEIKFILIAIGFMFLYFTCETINVTRTLKELGEKSTFLRNFRYTLIGFFFSSITPAASRWAANGDLLYESRWLECCKIYTCFVSKFNFDANCNDFYWID